MQHTHSGREPGPRFWKYQGTGNDFIILDERGRGVKAEVPSRAQAQAWCDRHQGIGADGVLTVMPARLPGCDARMHITNADGSVPEMCGNGLRCVALFLAEGEGAGRVELVVESDAGPRPCLVERVALGCGDAELGMGKVTLGPGAGLAAAGWWDVGGTPVEGQPVSVGNPHLVLKANRPSLRDAEQWGPALVRHPLFPEGTNVEWVERDGAGLSVLVFERGVGITQACGTGAVASAFAAHGWGWVDVTRPGGVPVKVLGGTLWVGQRADGTAWLKGPARRVYTGEMAPA